MMHQQVDWKIHPTVVERVNCGAWFYTQKGLWGQEEELYSICTHRYSHIFGCVCHPDNGCDDVGMFAEASVSSCLMLCLLLEQSWAITAQQFPSLSFWYVVICYYKNDVHFDQCTLCQSHMRSSKWEITVLEWCEISSSSKSEQFVDGVDHFLLCSLHVQSVVLYNYGHKLQLSVLHGHCSCSTQWTRAL
jgi:hypothetical protein